MKTNEDTIGLVSSNATETTKDICRSLAKKGISAIVVQRKPRSMMFRSLSISTPGRDNRVKICFSMVGS